PKGVEQKVIESIPTFIYLPSFSEGVILECAICLSAFEEKEVGRSLPRCLHAFHVECIDMWLYSHSTCPICRAHVVWRSLVFLVVTSIRQL
ncbi:RING-H2 finger protein ATL2, partial [Bienertia sinuspersici]